MKFLLIIFASSVFFILSGCGSSSEDKPTSSSHCSDKNEYSKESRITSLFYKFKRNDCNNLTEFQSFSVYFHLQTATFSTPEGTFLKCALSSGKTCSSKTNFDQYLTFESTDGNKQITYHSQLGTNTISEDTRYLDGGVEVNSEIRYITVEDPDYDFLYQRIFNSESFFIEATKNATLVLPTAE